MPLDVSLRVLPSRHTPVALRDRTLKGSWVSWLMSDNPQGQSPPNQGPSQAESRERNRRVLRPFLLLITLFAVLVFSVLNASSAWWDRAAPFPPREIFAGITYGRDRLEPSAEGSGV